MRSNYEKQKNKKTANHKNNNTVEKNGMGFIWFSFPTQ